MNTINDDALTPSMERWCNAWMDATGIYDWAKAIEAYYNKYHTTNLA